MPGTYEKPSQEAVIAQEQRFNELSAALATIYDGSTEIYYANILRFIANPMNTTVFNANEATISSLEAFRDNAPKPRA